MSEPSYFEALSGGIEVIRWPHKHPLPESEIVAYFESRRMLWTRWSKGPAEDFFVHSHDYRKILFCIEGAITFTFPDLEQELVLRHGDRLSLPSGIPHGAHAGPEGSTCIEAGV